MVGRKLREALAMLQDASTILLELLEAFEYDTQRDALANELTTIYYALSATIEDIEDLSDEY